MIAKTARRASRFLLTQAPEPAVSLLRRLVAAFGWLTAPWRSEPDFIVLGAQRAATTTLYRILSEHPGVVRPTQAKGIGYFDEEHHRGPRWYRSHFPLTRVLRSGGGPRRLTFESRGYYLHHPLSPERIARELPDVRVVAVVRDPVERAYSAYRHEHARGFDDLSFAEAVEQETQRLAGEVDRIRADPAYRSHAHRHHAYLTRSQYAEQVHRYVDALGPERVHVVDAGLLLSEDPGPELHLLEDFLGLARWQPAKLEHWNARPSSPLDAELEARLRAHFAPFDEQLATLTGRTPSWVDAASNGTTRPRP